MPQVAGDSGGAAEAVVDGVTGLVVRRPRRADDVAAALGRLLDDPRSRGPLGSAARARAESAFAYDVLADRLHAASGHTRELVTEGRRIIQASWAGTAVFAIACCSVSPRPAVLGAVERGVGRAVRRRMCGVRRRVPARGASQSHRRDHRGDAVLPQGGGTPRPVRRWLFASLAVEVVVAVEPPPAPAVHSQATGVLAPMWGLSLCGLWAARHGRFKPR